MHIRIMAVGRIKEPGYLLAQAEYIKRLQRYTRLEIVEVEDEPLPSGARERQAVKKREGERLLRRLTQGCLQVALDSRGAQFTSEEFASWLGRQQLMPHSAPPHPTPPCPRSTRYPVPSTGCSSFRSGTGAQRGQGDVVFMLGGTLGLSPAVLDQAQLRLSLSAFTFPHQLARIVLLEQLYRAYRILRQEPYHY